MFAAVVGCGPDAEIDWDEMRKDIDFRVRSNPNLLPEEDRPYLELNKQKDLPDEAVITEPISDDFKAKVIALYKFYVSTIKSFLPMYMPMIDQYYDTLTNVVKEYIITGKGTDVPYDWFGKVGPSSAFGEPVVFAMANESPYF